MDDETQIMFLATIAIMIAFVGHMTSIRASRQIVHDSIYQGGDFVRDCLFGHRRNSFDLLRMEPEMYATLCNLLRTRDLLQDGRNVMLEEQVAIFLLTIGHSERNRATQYTFQHSGQTISKYFNLVLNAICELGKDYIQFPVNTTPAKIRCNSRFYPYFKDCLGAIDGTHIPAWVPLETQGRFRNRKQVCTQNVMAMVGFDMKFHYVLAGWEGSASDSRVLYSAIDDNEYPLIIPEGKYYLADSGYPNIMGFLTPHRGYRYHLSEFNASGAKPIEREEELFNHRHSSLRTTVERAFGLLKSRFPILKHQVQYPFRTQAKIVLATCVLHNFILQMNSEAIQFEDNEDEDIYNCRQMDDDEESSRQLRLRGSNNVLRNEITKQMWNDYTK